MPQTNSLDFSSPASAEKALKKVSQLLGRAGQPVAGYEFIQKKRRTADVNFQEAFLTLVSGQTITLRVNVTGDIYQVLINNSLRPLKEHSDTEKAVVEIAAQAEKSQAAFQKAQARKVVALPKGMVTARPKLVEALQQQVSALDIQLSERRATIMELQAKLGVDVMTDSVATPVPAVPKTGNEPTSWFGFKLVNQAFVDQLGPMEAPSRFQIGAEVFLALGTEGDKRNLAAKVIGANFRAAKVHYTLAVPTQAVGDQPMYAVLYDVDSVNVASPDEVLDSATQPEPVDTLEHFKEPVLTTSSTFLALASAYVAARELVAASGAMLDDASTEGAKAYLQIGLEVVETNGPISLEEGNVEQARLQLRMAESFKAAIAMLDSASAQVDDKALEQLVTIAQASAASEDEIADQTALATLLALSMVDVAEGIYFLSEKGRQHLNDNGYDAYGEPFAE